MSRKELRRLYLTLAPLVKEATLLESTRVAVLNTLLMLDVEIAQKPSRGDWEEESTVH